MSYNDNAKCAGIPSPQPRESVPPMNHCIDQNLYLVSCINQLVDDINIKMFGEGLEINTLTDYDNTITSKEFSITKNLNMIEEKLRTLYHSL